MHLPASVRVYLCLNACDMRKSLTACRRWCGITWGWMFVFASRRRDRVKILYWDRDGFPLWSKRLEAGTYAIPAAEGPQERRRESTAQELGALLSRIDLSQARRRKRYQRKSAHAA